MDFRMYIILSVNVWPEVKIPDRILDFQGSGTGETQGQVLQTVKGDPGNI